MALCANCGEENPERARFCLGCGSPLAAAPPPPPPVEERKVITAVFTDIVGSTAAAENLDPEDVRARLAPYYARLRKELERHGGSVEKFIGDAVVAVFGAPVAHEDDPERAVRAALAINDAIDELNSQDAWLDLKIRTAVHTGEALVVLGTAAGEGEGMAAGDVMNTAARLQGAAPVNGIVVGERTYAATRDVIEYRPGEPVQAKGKAEPIPVWEVVGTKQAATALAHTPLVGRDEERARLWELWEQVRSRRARALAAVVGNPGVGKSRLLHDFTVRAREDGRVMYGRCLSYGEGITYWPITEIVKQAADILQTDDEETAGQKLGGLVDGLPTADPDELRTIAASLSNLVGVPCTPRGTYTATEITQGELHWGIRRLLELLAAERPVVVLLEDLHWAEPTLLELVRFIADGASDAPLLILGSARPELLDSDAFELAADGDRKLIRIDALTREQSEALLERLTEGTQLSPALVETVLERADGNPLFLEEIVRMLADERLLAADGSSTLEAIPVPSSLEALIGSRLDRLPARHKTTAQHAAVVGMVFWSGAVADLAESADVDPLLEELTRREFVYPRTESTVGGEREFVFKHILIRDVSYARLPKGRRAALHVRFADWVGRLPGSQEEFIEIVAHHLERACLLAREVARSPIEPPILRAVETLRGSAERAERREGMREADRYYARALELVGDGFPREAADLRLRRGRTRIALGQLREAGAELAELADEALHVGRRDVRCAALIALANIDYKQGRAAAARERLDEAEALARELDDRALLIRATYEAVNARSWFEGEVDTAVADLRRVLALAESMDDRALRIEGHMRIGTILFNIGDLAGSEAEFEMAVALAGESGSVRDEARAASLLVNAKYYLGKLDEAERLAVDALEWLDRIGDNFLQLQNLRALAIFALSKREPLVAEERLRNALQLALEIGGWLVIEVYRYLIEALLQQDRVQEARQLLAFAARSLPEEDAYARAALLIAEGRVTAAEGEQNTAVASFDAALRVLEEREQHLDVAETRLAYGRALRMFGEMTGARVEFERARTILKRIGAARLLAEVDAELAEIGEEAGRTGPLAST